MLGKQHPRIVAAELGKLLAQHLAHEKFLFDPDRDGRREAFQPPRGEAVIGLKQSLELQVGLVVKRDGLDVRKLQTGLVEDIGDRMPGKEESCFLRVKRSSWAAATISPSTISAAALS